MMLQICAHVPFLLACLCSPVCGTERATLTLRDNWHVKQLVGDQVDPAALSREALSPDGTWLASRMPAQVHDVLLAHGKISDPRIGKNAADSAWVGEEDWAYACTFPTPQGAGQVVYLRFQGLDTLAAAYLNGREIGRFENMYRRYVVDVGEKLAPAGKRNLLLIIFSSPLRFLEKAERPAQHRGLAKHKYLRKCHSDFGSYLGARPHAVKIGVFRDVFLDLPGPAWIEDLWVRSALSPDFSQARVQVGVELRGARASLGWSLVDPTGREVASGTNKGVKDALEFTVDVKQPELWWPRPQGTPHLYSLKLHLSLDGRVLDRRETAVGIREIRPVLRDPQSGEKRFRFDVNGRPMFLPGACWAPLEGLTHCWNQERAARLLDLFEHGGMNVLRIWGEGNIPPQEFYDACDRRGILIWQDFMFGYSMHPSGDPAFDANCRAEIEDMIRRLRNHPSILLWCGGNENHMGWNFARGTEPTVGTELFGEIMPELCGRLDPTRLFHPSSPYGGRAPNWPLEGDWHDYTTLKFCPQASVPLFASEVGRASAPALSSMQRFLSVEDLWPKGHDPAIRAPGRPAWPPMWQYRSVGGSWDKVGAVEQFLDPESAKGLIRVLGTAHGEYLRDRVERQRRGVPLGSPDGNRRCWGNMVWRLNDSWPIVYWSVIDYYLEPKIPFYYLRRAYATVLVSFERTPDKIFVWVVNDSPSVVTGTLTVQRRRFGGQSRGKLLHEVRLAPGEAKRCLETTELGPIYLRNEFLQASFAGSEATLLLIGERYLHLPRAKLKARVVEDTIALSTDAFAYQVALEVEGVTGAVFEDNFFHMPPGGQRNIRILHSAGGRKVRVEALNAESSTLEIK